MLSRRHRRERNGLKVMSLERIQQLLAWVKVGLGIAIAMGLIWRSQTYREGVAGYEVLAPAMMTIAAVLLLLTTAALVLGKSGHAEFERDA
jgi:uncharacterized membrane protein